MIRFAPDTPPWLRLTVRAALREAAMIQFRHRTTIGGALTGDPNRPWRQDLWVRHNRRGDNIEQQVLALRTQAAVAAYRAGVVEEAWRRVWKPLAFSAPIFVNTRARYASVDLAALQRDWRAELARLEEAQQVLLERKVAA